MLKYNLLTKYSDDVENSSIFTSHPNPLKKRKNFKLLNGYWKYKLDYEYETKDYEDSILVPYCIESYLSNVRCNLLNNEFLFYKKELSFDDIYDYEHIILHFDGVFQHSTIYINEQEIYESYEGFMPIIVDIKPYITKGNNIIIVKVSNKPNRNFSQGKEGHKRGGMWYTKTTGIYKPVWIEWYNDDYIEDIDIETNISGNVTINVKSKETVKYDISFDDKIILSGELKDSCSFNIENANLWSPDSPNLYYVTFKTQNDEVSTYFAFRKFEIVGNKFYLNDKEFFINGVLDQGYFSDGIYTPGSYDAYKDDILTMKKLGFNTLRKHIKYELDMYYYLADKYGMLIMQDFPNSGKYNFFVDSFLPLLGLKIKKHETSNVRISSFVNLGEYLVNSLSKHPSVIYFTIFNEGWGEFDTNIIYTHFKTKYPNIIFDSASGWFIQSKSDVLSIHNYFFKLKVPKSTNPVIITEFGGYNYKINDHVFNTEKSYGYHTCKTKQDLENDLSTLYSKIRELKNKGLAGCIYTQLSDVEDETNGLVTYDREIIKIDKMLDV